MRFRISLRLFLILFTLAGVLLGGVGRFVWRLRDQGQRHRAAVEKLDKLGCTTFDYDGWAQESPPVWFVNAMRNWIDADAYSHPMSVFIDRAVTPQEAIERFAMMRNLQSVGGIDLHVDEVTGEVAAELAEFKNCQHLSIDCKKLTLPAAQKLAETRELVELDVDAPLDDATAGAIAQLAKLERLSIDPQKLTPSGVKPIRGFAALHSLSLTGPIENRDVLAALLQGANLHELGLLGGCSSEALAAVRDSKSLADLLVACEKAPDDLISHLASVEQLESLILSRLRPSQLERLGELTACKRLRYLHLLGTPLTVDDFRRLPPLPQLRELFFTGDASDAEILALLTIAKECVIEMQSSRGTSKEYRLQGGKLQVSEERVNR